MTVLLIDPATAVLALFLNISLIGLEHRLVVHFPEHFPMLIRYALGTATIGLSFSLWCLGYAGGILLPPLIPIAMFWMLAAAAGAMTWTLYAFDHIWEEISTSVDEASETLSRIHRLHEHRRRDRTHGQHNDV